MASLSSLSAFYFLSQDFGSGTKPSNRSAQELLPSALNTQLSNILLCEHLTGSVSRFSSTTTRTTYPTTCTPYTSWNRDRLRTLKL